MSYATPALLTNLAIVIGIVAIVALTGNVLAIAGLMLLKDLPIVVPQMFESDELEEQSESEGNSMGFIK